MNKVIQYPYRDLKYLTRHAQLWEKAEQHQTANAVKFRDKYVKEYAQTLLNGRDAKALLAMNDSTRWGYEITKDGITSVSVSTSRNDEMLRDLVDTDFYDIIRHFVDCYSHRFSKKQYRLTCKCLECINFCLDEIAVNILNENSFKFKSEAVSHCEESYRIHMVFTFNGFIFCTTMLSSEPEDVKNGLEYWYRDESSNKSTRFSTINSIEDNILVVNLTSL